MTVRQIIFLRKNVLFFLIATSSTLLFGLAHAQDEFERKVVAPWSKSYNNRGQIVAECKKDAASPVGPSYECGSSLSKVPNGVIQITYKYCEPEDQASNVCDHVGVLISKQRLAGYSPTPSIFTYYPSSDSSGCGSNKGSCHIEGQLRTFERGQITVTFERYDLASGSTSTSRSKVTRIRYSDGPLLDLQYGTNGQLKSSTLRSHSDGSPSASDETSTFTYDESGNLTNVTNGAGLAINYKYQDSKEPHRLTSITDSMGGSLDIPNNLSFGPIPSSGNKAFDDRISLEWKHLYSSMRLINDANNGDGSVSSLRALLIQFRPADG